MEAEEVGPEVAIEQTCVRLSGTFVLTVKAGRLTWGKSEPEEENERVNLTIMIAAVQSYLP